MDESRESSRPEGADRESRVLGAARERPGRIDAIFFGAHGLRPLWRLVLYVAVYYALESAFLILTAPLFEGHERSLWVALAIEFEHLVAALLPAVGFAQLEDRPFGAYGLPPDAAFGPLFWRGAAWGLGSLSVLILALRGVGAFYFGALALHGLRALKFAVFWAVLFLVGAAFEEFLFRGYSQFTLAQSVGFWPAAVLLSARFGWAHLTNQGENWMGALGTVAIALFWCLTLRRTGSLWFSLGMHTAWNWGETFLYSVPNSGWRPAGHLLRSSLRGSAWLTGGAVGPEGSVLLYLLVALMWLIFDRLYPAQPAPRNLPAPAA